MSAASAEGSRLNGQADFAAALLDPARPIPPGLVGPDGKPSMAPFQCLPQ